MLDICFGESECGMLKVALRTKNIVMAYNSLELGKIAVSDFETVRKEWNDHVFSFCSKRQRKKILAEQTKQFKHILDAAKRGKDLRIWHASAPYSRAGFYHLIFSLQGIDCNVYHVEFPANAPGCLKGRYDRAWAEISPLDIDTYLPLQKRLSVEERDAIAKKWSKLAEENTELRINLNGELTSVSIDYLDANIVDLAPVGTYKLANHIANCLTGISHSLGDGFYCQRIEALVKQGKLEIVERSKKAQEYYAKTYLRNPDTRKSDAADELVFDYLKRTNFDLALGITALDDYNLQKSYNILQADPNISKYEFAKKMGIRYDDEEIAFDKFLSRLGLMPREKEQVYVRKYDKALQLWKTNPEITKEEFVRVLKIKKNPRYLFYRSRIM